MAARIPPYETTLKISDADRESAETVRTAPVVGDTGVIVGGPSLDFPANLEIRNLDPLGGGGQGTVDRKAPPGADPNANNPKPVQAQMGNTEKEDLRVFIRVPNGYRYNDSRLPAGIRFPYTPQISVEHKADFTPQNPLHTNYSLNFYRSSSVSDITIQGMFTVQNDNDAIQYLAAVHLLRALTKGRFGGTDDYRGSPPPICRLTAYGTYMLNNAPISIASFKQDLPFDVDYYYLTRSSLGSAMVPIRSNITVVCKLMVSRSEMLTASVNNWLSGDSRKAGLL
jgi:hypothetical protein